MLATCEAFDERASMRSDFSYEDELANRLVQTLCIIRIDYVVINLRKGARNSSHSSLRVQSIPLNDNR